MAEFVTIGVYGFDEAGFFRRLRTPAWTLFATFAAAAACAGSAYAFANSQRLQGRLAELGIRYIYRSDLAPSLEVRRAQEAADKANKTAKRKRTVLGTAFVEAYRRETLDGFDSHQFVIELGEEARVVALFCVERSPAACHRSLVAERLEVELGATVGHLLPD